MYIGVYFRACRDHVKRRCDKWAIMSSKYGLVMPTQVIDPYEQSLNTTSLTYRRQWVQRVRQKIDDEFPNQYIYCLAGKQYREALKGRPNVSFPLCHIGGIGKQLAWLKSNR